MLRVLAAKLLAIMALVAGPCALVTKRLRECAADTNADGAHSQDSEAAVRTVLEALKRCCLPLQQRQPSPPPTSTASGVFSPARLVTASGADGVPVSDLAKMDLPWDAWLRMANTELLPRAATLHIVSKRHDLGSWDYPPLDEDAAANAAALAAVLETL